MLTSPALTKKVITEILDISFTQTAAKVKRVTDTLVVPVRAGSGEGISPSPVKTHALPQILSRIFERSEKILDKIWGRTWVLRDGVWGVAQLLSQLMTAILKPPQNYCYPETEFRHFLA